MNLLADMGVQPATLQPNLRRAEPSHDHTPPSVSVFAPGAPAQVGQPLLLQGGAVDEGEGRIGGVEVSISDDWHPARGWERWQYKWIPDVPGDFVIRARAVDDSGNQALSEAVVIEVQSGK